MKIIKTILTAAFAALALSASAQNNVAEEVAWTIGDEPIYKSEIEQAYQEALQDRMPIKGDPYCVIPEQIAIQRLFLHQAELDTIEAQPAMVQQQVDAQINYLIANLGTREKLEQYFRRPLPEIREYYTRSISERSRVSQVQNKLTQNLKITPSDVRKYFNSLPEDSIPFVPLQVEVQIVTLNPVIPRQEIEDVKARLREYSDRISSGASDFSTLAILYSEDRASSSRGGELGFMGRGELVPNLLPWLSTSTTLRKCRKSLKLSTVTTSSNSSKSVATASTAATSSSARKWPKRTFQKPSCVSTRFAPTSLTTKKLPSRTLPSISPKIKTPV